MYNWIYHPQKQLFYSIFSLEGQQVLNNYLLLGGSPKQKLFKNADVYAPKAYFQGLTENETKKRLKRIQEGHKTSHKNPKAYRDFETDFRNGERIKTKPSRYTNQWKKYFPNATSLEDKARLTGVPLDIVEKVYNKGMAAWRTGHRPGANVQQWGYARVHSFFVKGKTFYTTDNKLAKLAIKQSKKAKDWFDWVDGLCDTKENREKNKWCARACKKTKCK